MNCSAICSVGIKEAEEFLIEIRMRGSLGRDVPTDPTIYRFYEIRAGLWHYFEGFNPRRVW